MYEEIRDPSARVRAICEYGCQVEVDAAISPKNYQRAQNGMMRMAAIYHQENNFESAFILYSKFVTLYFEKLPKHPDYKSTVTAADRSKNRKLVQDVMAKAEGIKQELRKKYEIEASRRLENERLQRIKDEQAARLAEDEERLRVAARAEQERSDHAVALRLQAEYEPLAPSAPLAQQEDTAEPQNKDSAPPSLDETAAPDSHPSIDRSTKPCATTVSHFLSTGVETGNKHGLRDVHVPQQLIASFLFLTEDNSARNVETCGVLCGKLSYEVFTITHLIIPKQTATPDSCTTQNEEELFNYQDKHDLITLGWIHTHPSQTAFLSSVDLHTQCSYQLMLPEAIAIVCSVKFNDVGYFYLTPDHGLNYIAKCKKTGFHPHTEASPLFEECLHVRTGFDQNVIIEDLRSK